MRTIDVDLLGNVFEELIDEVISSGERFVITRDRIDIARLEPIARKQAPKSLWGIQKGQIEIPGDIIEPIDLDWGVNR